MWPASRVVYVADRRFPGLEAALAAGRSTYEVLHERIDDAVAHAVETIETVPAAPREVALLGTEIGTPMLLVSRHGHTAEGEPVERVRTWYRVDRYSFVTHISRPPTLSGEALVGTGA